jgi:hypothetical protein
MANDYESRIPEMPTLTPGRTLDASVIVGCNHALSPSDKFNITAQLYALPDSSVSQHPKVSIFNYDSSAVSIEQ